MKCYKYRIERNRQKKKKNWPVLVRSTERKKDFNTGKKWNSFLQFTSFLHALHFFKYTHTKTSCFCWPFFSILDIHFCRRHLIIQMKPVNLLFVFFSSCVCFIPPILFFTLHIYTCVCTCVYAFMNVCLRERESKNQNGVNVNHLLTRI